MISCTGLDPAAGTVPIKNEKCPPAGSSEALRLASLLRSVMMARPFVVVEVGGCYEAAIRRRASAYRRRLKQLG